MSSSANNYSIIYESFSLVSCNQNNITNEFVRFFNVYWKRVWISEFPSNIIYLNTNMSQLIRSIKWKLLKLSLKS